MTEPQSGQAVTTSEEVDALYGAYGEFPGTRLARIYNPEQVAGYESMWGHLTLASQASLGEKIASAPDNELPGILDGVFSVIEDKVVSPLDGATAAQVKGYVGSDLGRAREALAYEQAGTNRKTVVEHLQGVIANADVLVETADQSESASPRIGSVIDTLGTAVEGDATS